MRKKNIILLIVVVVLMLSSCTKTKIEYYPNGAIKSKITYKNGKEHGITTYYHQHYHTPSLEISMKNGKKNGKLTRYFFNGNIESEAMYSDDIQKDREALYDIKGGLLQEIYYKNGKKDGSYKTWHGKDLLKEVGQYKEDLLDGEWQYFDERGMQVGEGHFNKGEGILTAYDEHGVLSRITHYKNNQKNGDEIYFNAQGDTIRIWTFENERIVKMKEQNKK
jgi:antitoxin component YwqK of YwqJK toxin-antitoxin module